MTTLGSFLAGLETIDLPDGAPPVCETTAEEIRARFAPRCRIRRGGRGGDLAIAVKGGPGAAAGLSFRVGRDGRAILSAGRAHHLFAFFSWLADTRSGEPLARFRERRVFRPAFLGRRPVFDLYFAQSGRTIRGMDREAYVRAMARAGFTHLEVNSLAAPEPAEEGVPGEVYPRFYTYCPALDQFVTSFLNRGTYPAEYLRANLERLEENAALAARYGLVPSLTVFEPRSVPESLLAKYPELRGCRVDHPFRSFQPRYNLAVSHPLVQRHYRELVRELLRAVPEIGLLSVWSNDSGAGFEHTRSLYVGANGSAYLVREWSEEDAVARAAARNVTGFLRLLLEAGREVNPSFRVATRLEPFGPEREEVMRGLGRGLDVEAATLLAAGWDSPYGHPAYPDCEIGPFTLYNHEFKPEEGEEIRRLARRGARTHVLHAHGPVNNFEPLLHVPAPRLTFEKLSALFRGGARYLAHLGGLAPPAAVPLDVNAEVTRRFLFDPDLDLEATLREIAEAHAGEEAPVLVEAWRGAEEAVRGFMPNPLYFSWGVWYRILTRPLVPDIDAIPEKERAYYEEHLLATHHNPHRVDLARDVLFTLMTPALAAKTVRRIDGNALPPLDRALGRLEGREHPVLADLADRLAALRCFMVTRRNVAAWIANVHGYLRAGTDAARERHRARLAEMVESEIANTRRLLALLAEGKTEILALSGHRETTFIYDERLPDHLRRKIRLMKEYGDLEPRIDPDYMWRTRAREERRS